MSVYRAWKALEEELLDNLEFVDVAFSWLAWGKNALYEALLDKKAPGASSQAVKGHDHYDVPSGGQGGRIVGRSMAAMCGMGAWGWAEVEITGGNTSTWIQLPTNYAGAGLPSFRAWCSAGMVSASGNQPSAPCLDAQVYVYSDIEVHVRIQHATTSFLSATATHTPNSPFLSSLLRVTNIPANDEGWNPYELEVMAETTGFIYLGLVNHSESPIVAGSYVAGQPPSQAQQLGR